MGMATILHARRIVLHRDGEVEGALRGAARARTADHELPASFLQVHPAVEIWLDRAAAAEIGEL